MQQRTWERATGLAADVEAYGKWMLDQARERIGQFYPTVRLNDGQEATVIAWLWARTVCCPNPLCGAQMPLVKSFVLSAKKGEEWCLEAVVDHDHKTVHYKTRKGEPSRGGTVTRRGAICIVCSEPASLKYIKTEGKAGRLGTQMTAIVAAGRHGRLFLSPEPQHDRIARSAKPEWAPNQPTATNSQYMGAALYGLDRFDKLFTQRQLLALTTFCNLIHECRERVLADAIAAGLKNDGKSLEAGGFSADAYADATATLLAFAVDKLANHNATLCSWDPGSQKISHVFTRQTLSMVWDYAEANPLGTSSGKFFGSG